MERTLFFRRRKRDWSEIDHRSDGKDRGRAEGDREFLWRGEHWVSGHCNGLDGPLAACLGRSWVHADFGPKQISCHCFMGQQVH